jgi:hypothetical protein
MQWGRVDMSWRYTPRIRDNGFDVAALILELLDYCVCFLLSCPFFSAIDAYGPACLCLSQQVYAGPALETLKKLSAEVAAHQNNPETLKLILSSVRLLFRIFYSLNFQGITPVRLRAASCLVCLMTDDMLGKSCPDVVEYVLCQPVRDSSWW